MVGRRERGWSGAGAVGCRGGGASGTALGGRAAGWPDAVAVADGSGDGGVEAGRGAGTAGGGTEGTIPWGARPGSGGDAGPGADALVLGACPVLATR